MYDNNEMNTRNNTGENKRNISNDEYPANKDYQGIDKAPGEESATGEQVKREDLKGKEVDADPTIDQPIRQLP